MPNTTQQHDRTVKRAGFYTDMGREEYDAHSAINCSTLKQFMKSSLHAEHQLKFKDNDKSDALIFGSAVHAYVLEPEVFDSEFHVMPSKIDRRTKVGKEEYAKQLDLAAGRDLIKHEQWVVIQRMGEMLRKHPSASDLLCCGDTEVSLVTDDDFRCRIDQCDTDRHILVDLKTCMSADMPSIAQSVRKYHYAMQARFYLNCYQSVTGHEAEFYFVFIEKSGPHDINCIKLSEDWLAIGQAQIDEAMTRLRDWKILGPRGYSESITTLEVPSYLMKHVEEVPGETE